METLKVVLRALQRESRLAAPKVDQLDESMVDWSAASMDGLKVALMVENLADLRAGSWVGWMVDLKVAQMVALTEI